MSTVEEQVERVRRARGDQWADFARRWAGHATRTRPVEREGIQAAISDVYRIAGLAPPRVVVVSSPGVMAFAGAFATRIWAARQNDPAFDPAPKVDVAAVAAGKDRLLAASTLMAVRSATAAGATAPAPTMPPGGEVWLATLEHAYSPADNATANAVELQQWRDLRGLLEEVEALSWPWACITDAMRDDFGNPEPTEMMALASQDWAAGVARRLFGASHDADGAVSDAASWWRHSQPGNTNLYDSACIAAARDLLGLKLAEHAAFAAWERSSAAGGYRFMHPQFCLVSEFPQVLDEAQMDHPTQVHGKDMAARRAAPAMRWGDGWLV